MATNWFRFFFLWWWLNKSIDLWSDTGKNHSNSATIKKYKQWSISIGKWQKKNDHKFGQCIEKESYLMWTSWAFAQMVLVAILRTYILLNWNEFRYLLHDISNIIFNKTHDFLRRREKKRDARAHLFNIVNCSTDERLKAHILTSKVSMLNLDMKNVWSIKSLTNSQYYYYNIDELSFFPLIRSWKKNNNNAIPQREIFRYYSMFQCIGFCFHQNWIKKIC